MHPCAIDHRSLHAPHGTAVVTVFRQYFSDALTFLNCGKALYNYSRHAFLDSVRSDANQQPNRGGNHAAPPVALAMAARAFDQSQKASGCTAYWRCKSFKASSSSGAAETRAEFFSASSYRIWLLRLYSMQQTNGSAPLGKHAAIISVPFGVVRGTNDHGPGVCPLTAAPPGSWPG